MIGPGSGFFDALAAFVIGGALVALTARWLRLPTIVSYLLAGLLIGPVLGFVGQAAVPPATLDLISELGVILLLFIVGMELSFDRLRDVGKVAVAAGLGQVLFTSVFGLGICLALGFELVEAIFIATALTFSSTAVVVKLLDQKKELHSLYGRIAVGIFLVQDLVVIVVLTVLSGLSGGEARDAGALGWGLAKAFLGMSALLSAALIGARFVLPAVLGWAARSTRTLLIWSLAWCLALVLAAYALGLSMELGAFLAGLALAQQRSAGDLRRRTHPLMTFFIAVFFVSLGAQMELHHARAYWLESILLSLFVLLGNPFIFIWIIARLGYGERTSFLTSVTVAQISEFSFVFAAMGLSMGLIGEPILSVIGVVGIVTIALSAYMIVYNHQLYAWLRRRGGLRLFRARLSDDEEPPEGPLRDHVIVVGMNDLGRRVAGLLHEQGQVVLAIDTDARKLVGLPCRTMVGDVDYASTLEEAGLAGARVAISALRIEPVNKLFVFRCRTAGVPVGVYAGDRATRTQLAQIGANYLAEARQTSGADLAAHLSRLGVVPA